MPDGFFVCFLEYADDRAVILLLNVGFDGVAENCLFKSFRFLTLFVSTFHCDNVYILLLLGLGDVFILNGGGKVVLKRIVSVYNADGCIGKRDGNLRRFDFRNL